MAFEQKRVLVVEDEANMRHMLQAMLAGNGYAVTSAANGAEGLELLDREEFDFVLSDIRMPEMDGMTFLEAALRRKPQTTVIMMSAFGTIDTALAAMKKGAYDYISKPFKTDEVILVLKKAEERQRLQQENRDLKRRLQGVKGKYRFGEMVAASRAMDLVFQLATKVASHATTVLVTGESGTGKELVARGIHGLSPRRDRAFIAINCAGIPENLLESELFGHVQGAFTGADRNRKGIFLEADGGTLFLDEIGELPISMQAKLLRVLEEREVRQVGSSTSKKIDVRILAATARNLGEQVAAGRFREDLFFRLNVVNIHLPPLHERREDIPLLVHHFISQLGESADQRRIKISPAAMDAFQGKDWQGNIRELRNTVERAVILCENGVIQPEDVGDQRFDAVPRRRIDDFFGTYSVKKAQRILEERMIRRALAAVGGNKTKASELLELSYPSLLSKLKKYGADGV